MTESQTTPRLIDTINLPLGKPVDLAVWVLKRTGIRCKLLPSQVPVTYRLLRFEVEGEIITVMPSKVWQFKNTVYLTGETISSRIDVNTLGLTPLKLEEQGMFVPDNENELIEDHDPFMKYYLPIMAYGPRREFEMEQVIPGSDPEDCDMDSITLAVDYYERGDIASAFELLGKVLAEDLRCIDAHAHLGNWEFPEDGDDSTRKIERATKHYEIGMRIAELSFGKDFHDLIPWGFIDNRPYLRCLHGYGLCLWRSGKATAARGVFEKMLWLNPRDNQGVRFLLADIDAGRDWASEQGSE